jgi:hypothetical protein
MAREVKLKVKNAVLYTDGLIRIDGVRLSYPHLARPHKGDSDDGNAVAKYSVVGLMPKKTHAAVKNLLDKISLEFFKEKNKGARIPKDKQFCRDGDDVGKDEYEGMWTVNASETKRPVLKNQRKETLSVEEAEELFFAGCWGTLLIRPWWQDNKFGKRLNANLISVQYVRTDTAFGEGRISEDEVDEALDELEDVDGDYVEAGDEDDDAAAGL